MFSVYTALSAGVICASLALGEAGIEMYDLVSSCSLVRKLNQHRNFGVRSFEL